MKKNTKTILIEGHEIEVSHPDKILFPKDGITKMDLVEYYEKAAPHILPYLKDRPISMKRYVDGIGKEGFYQKEVPDNFPKWIDRVLVPLREEKGKQAEIVVNDTATLVYLAEQDCITPHAWLSKKGSLDKPDKMIFDLDPSENGRFEDVVLAAHRLRKILEHDDLVPFVMATGSTGLHVVVPLVGKDHFDDVRNFAKITADRVAEEGGPLFTTETRIKSRRGKVFIDYLRNAFAATAVTPYCVRARNGAPVATPVGWGEITRKDFLPDRYTVKNIFARLSHQKDDPWADFDQVRRPLSHGEV